MLEATLVLAALASVGLVVLLATLLTPPVMIMLALGTLLLVSRKIPVPRRWWLSPSGLHVHLTDAEQRRIKPWNRLGGIGFVLSVVGGLAAIAAMLMAR
jgi:hypothetical protein